MNKCRYEEEYLILYILTKDYGKVLTLQVWMKKNVKICGMVFGKCLLNCGQRIRRMISMKKWLVLVGVLLTTVTLSLASEYDNVVTSQSASPTPGFVLLSSASIRFLGANHSYATTSSTAGFALARSTTSTYDPLVIATQTIVNCNNITSNSGTMTVDLFGITNTSYTFINRFGNCDATLFFTFPFGTLETNNVVPGLPYSGRRGK